MNTFQAFRNGVKNKDKTPMVFDWEKAAKLIKKHKAKHAGAGLRGDWEWTGGTIFKDGKPLPRNQTYVYLASTWAVPELEINGKKYECFKLVTETPGWNADTYWPESALKILKGDI